SQVEGAVVALVDIDAVKLAETRFRALVESAPDAMVIVDGAGEVRLVNAQAERMFGYQRAELIGKPVEQLVPERLRELHATHRADYAADPHVRAMGEGLELFGRRKDGTDFPVEIYLAPIRTPEGLLIAGTIRDITGRRALEDEKREAVLEERNRLAREVHDNL